MTSLAKANGVSAEASNRAVEKRDVEHRSANTGTHKIAGATGV
jgi:hypothetical protein